MFLLCRNPNSFSANRPRTMSQGFCRQGFLNPPKKKEISAKVLSLFAYALLLALSILICKTFVEDIASWTIRAQIVTLHNFISFVN